MWTPNPNLAVNAISGGLSAGSKLADLFQQRQNRKKLANLADMFKQGDYTGVGAGLVGMGQVGPGVSVANIPYQREQAQLSNDLRKRQIAVNEMNARRQGQVTYGKSPVYFRREDGSVGIGLTGSDGSFKELDGFIPAGTIQKIDTGTGTLAIDNRSGQPVTPEIEKDFSTRVIEEETAKAKVESDSELRTMERNLPGLRNVVNELRVLADKATYTKSGQAWDAVIRELGAEPSEAAVARARYIAMVDNQVLPLLRQTFGAAFTAKEGESLRATLGNPDAAPSEKKAILDAFINQKIRNIEARGGVVNTPNPTVEVVGQAGSERSNPLAVQSVEEAENLPSGTWVIINGRVGQVE